jgi:hypothetical protein
VSSGSGASNAGASSSTASRRTVDATGSCPPSRRASCFVELWLALHCGDATCTDRRRQ